MNRNLLLTIAATLIVCSAPLPSIADTTKNLVTAIEVSPKSIQLTGKRARTQLLVTGVDQDGRRFDLTRTATIASSDLIEVEKASGYVRPLRDGEGEVVVSYQGHTVKVPVHVAQAEHLQPISFRTEVLAVLTKQGCNSGSCHGKPNGRGALELSLNAFDPVLDQRSLVRGAFVRFTEPLVPEQSLLLKKPTLRIPHGGGKRLRKNEQPYEILRQWIEEGCHVETDPPKLVGIDVEPAGEQLLRLSQTKTQQFRVVARYSDGNARDVTRIATWTVSHEDVAKVNANGLVSGQRRGQVAVSVRFLEDVESVNLTVVEEVPGYQWSNPPAANLVDRLVHEKLKQLQYLPSDSCDDSVFIRRISLDIRGLLPTSAEAKTFLDDRSKDKRSKLIDKYLGSPEHAAYWSLKLADLLRINRENLSAEKATAFSSWVRSTVETNAPYDQFVRDLLVSKGKTSQNQPANFYRVIGETKMVAETVAQVFMGSRIMCAQCHNHPYEKWTQDNYYQIAAAFHEVDPVPQKKQNDDLEIKLTMGRTMANPRTGIVQKPWPTDVQRSDGEDRRIAFSNWLTSAKNPYFARVAVNRIWANLFGHGLVEPIDDFRSSNPAVNNKLLNELAAEFAKSGFDRRHLLRLILNSHTYQRSDKTNEFNATDESLGSHTIVRLLSAEQIQDAVQMLCNGPTDLKDLMTQQSYPHLTSFLKAFGQPERKTACACERRDEVSLDQALQMMNSRLVRDRVSIGARRFAKEADETVAEAIYLAAYSRRPTDREKKTVLDFITSSDDRNRAIEDIIWSILNTNEFIFQH